MHCILLRLNVLFLSVLPVFFKLFVHIRLAILQSINLICQISFIDTLRLYYIAPNAPIPPSISPNTASNKIKSINDRTNPAIANPLGFLNTPTNDKISPKTHKIQPNTGIQPRKIAIIANTNPAVPTPFDLCST